MDQNQSETGLGAEGLKELTRLRQAYRQAQPPLQDLTPDRRVALFWEMYLSLLEIEAEVEAGAKIRQKKSSIANERRQTVKVIQQHLGRWPILTDVITALSCAGAVCPDLVRTFESDLERLK